MQYEENIFHAGDSCRLENFSMWNLNFSCCSRNHLRVAYVKDCRYLTFKPHSHFHSGDDNKFTNINGGFFQAKITINEYHCSASSM